MKITELALSLPGDNGSYRLDAPPQIRTGGLGSDAGEAIRNGITIFVLACVVIALFFFLWGGIQWIMSSGDKNKLQAARNKIIYSIVGLVLAFVSFFILSVAGSIFGVELLQLSF